eukprot:4494439-Amphidinium_carterae.1
MVGAILQCLNGHLRKTLIVAFFTAGSSTLPDLLSCTQRTIWTQMMRSGCLNFQALKCDCAMARNRLSGI